jgi:hypothetical protein
MLLHYIFVMIGLSQSSKDIQKQLKIGFEKSNQKKKISFPFHSYLPARAAQ